MQNTLYFIFNNDKEIYQVANTGLNNHSENLIADIQKGLEICNLEVKDFDEIIAGIDRLILDYGWLDSGQDVFMDTQIPYTVSS